MPNPRSEWAIQSLGSSDKLNEQADKMREIAQARLDKARDAVSKYISESKMREKADPGVRATILEYAAARAYLVRAWR